jgi:protocatechuate 3,4-dioxygenase beta subunit
MRTVPNAVLIVLCGWLAAAGQIAQSSVQGRITDIAGRPLQGDITVIETGPDIRVSSYETDSQGRFSFSGFIGQSITVVAKADGYISAERQVALGTAMPQLQFALSPAGEVKGRVIDETGRAVAGAIVRLRYSGRARLHELGQEIGEVTTDDYGYFTLPFVEQRTPFIIDVSAAGRPVKSSLTMVLTQESMSGVLIAVSGKTQSVRGKVLDSAGQPVSGANVHLRWIGKAASQQGGSGTSVLQANRFTSTASDGSFQFEGVAEGDVVLVARHGNSRPGVIEGTVTTNTPLEVTLVIR